MLKIRLQKIGKKNDPSYRIALVEHTTSPQGKCIELLGSYSPKLKERKFNKERIQYWLTRGAQASPTVHNLLVDEKIISKEKVKAWKPKKRSEAKSSVASGEGGKKESESQKIEEAPKVEESAKVEEEKIKEVSKEEPKIEEPKIEEIPNIDTQEKKE